MFHVKPYVRMKKMFHVKQNDNKTHLIVSRETKKPEKNKSSPVNLMVYEKAVYSPQINCFTFYFSSVSSFAILSKPTR